MNISNLDLKDKSIIIYDGVCGFCNHTIQFILRNKPDKDIRFVAYQSETAQELMRQFAITPDMSSILLIQHKKYYTKSSAVLKILQHLQSPWRYLYYLIIIPGFIRDSCYSIISRYRYLIMGKSEQCRLLSAEERFFFLE